MTTHRPKLIEVALPLVAINEQSAREKSIRHGHPSTLHLWWARRPLAAARAVIWASLVDDPSGDPTLSPEEQERERQRLFGILAELVRWENTNDPGVLGRARAEITRCYPDGPPPILDPFGGGGAIPLEAQRLGLEAIAGDLNPVAVLIQKAMIEIPPRFAGRAPVHPDVDQQMGTWERAQGLAADFEAYGQWMRDEAQRRIGHLYPDATGPDGEKLTPIAWIWARTVESPDPSWDGHVPLVRSWTLRKRKGKPTIWVEPRVDRDGGAIKYEVKVGGSPSVEPTASRGSGTCLATGSAIAGNYIKSEGRQDRMSSKLIAVVAEGSNGRAYVSPAEGDENAASGSQASWQPEGANPEKLTGGTVYTYGFDRWWKLFSPRQLVALTTFSDLLDEVHEKVRGDAVGAGWADDEKRLRDGGDGATAYADAVVTYLAFVVDKCTDYWSTIATWATQGFVRSTFARQAIPMTWDWAEVNPFSDSTGNWMGQVDWAKRALDQLPATVPGSVRQEDARAQVQRESGVVVSTDPPYYDNISYADLSDYFYVWLRRNLSDIWPDETSTLMTPKAEELIANRYRAGSRDAAEQHFESGMAEFMADAVTAQDIGTPMTIYYAYKATETNAGEIRSTGWDTFLQAVLDAGMQVTATWPMRTERPGRMIGIGTNALASSIVLACRPRTASAPLASRGQFVAALRQELPEAVRMLQLGNIAPVDLPQSTIGPGIGVFSRYSKVVEADGSAMRVSTALSIINDVLAEVLDGEESELDADTRFASTWYAQHRWDPAPAGDADGLARAKNTSLSGVEQAGIGRAHGGEFQLRHRNDLPEDWSPAGDDRLTVWEVTQHLVRALRRSESDAAELLAQLGGVADRARSLAYVLFQKATDNKWADEATLYNNLITAWPELSTQASALGQAPPTLDV